MQQTTQKEGWMGGKGNPLGIVQKIETWPYNQIVYEQNNTISREEDPWNSLGFWDKDGFSNLG